MNGYRDDLRHCRFERLPVAKHFRSSERDFLSYASVWLIHNAEWTDRNRTSRESYRIHRLNALRPHGIKTGDRGVWIFAFAYKLKKFHSVLNECHVTVL